MLVLNNKKYYYILKLKFIFLNYNYLCFKKHYNNNLLYKCYKLNLGIIKIKSNFFNKLFNANKKIFFIKTNCLLIYFNDFIDYLKIFENLNENIMAFSSFGYFLNNKWFKNLNFFYYFYNNNYKLLLLLIILYINNIKIILFIIISKFILLLNHIVKKNILLS